jgi:hypothetical protein
MKTILFTILMLLALSCGINCQAQTLKEHVKQHQEELEERQRVEKMNYEKACQKGTIEAYNEYLKMYPHGKYVKEINNRISDYDLWEKAKSANTIAGYNEYVNKSKCRIYVNQANEAIAELQSVSIWQIVKNSDKEENIEYFMQKYPKSSCIEAARKRIHEIKAVNYYKNGEFAKAYDEFNNAGGRNHLQEANRLLYDKCTEFHEYSALTSYSEQEEFKAFLQKYPNSEHYNTVSNMLAVSMAKNFSMYVGDHTVNQALSYAKDDDTKNIVKSYAKQVKKNYSEYKRNQRKARIADNGGDFNFGLELLDSGMNMLLCDRRTLNIGYYNAGINMRVGNFKAPVQFEIGVKPGVILYATYYYYSGKAYDPKVKFHLPVSAKLKVNLCNIGRKSKLYVSALGHYNVVRNKDIEGRLAVGGGLGLGWRHWDWIVYYKQDLEENASSSYLDVDNNKYIGTSLAYYF